MKRNKNQIVLNSKWKFKTDPDLMGEIAPEDVANTTGATAQETQFFSPEYDDRHWSEISVPACWQAEGYLYNGVAWYRTRFNYKATNEKLVRIEFQGVDYFADVWLNGYYLGSHEGFFNHFSFDISRWIKENENLLVVRVDSPRGSNPKLATKQINFVKGALHNWDCNNLDFSPGGIFNDIHLVFSKYISIQTIKATPFINLEQMKARLLCEVTISNPSAQIKDITLTATVTPENFTGSSSEKKYKLLLSPGKTKHEIWINVIDPQLWWPWDLGEQNLYHIQVSASDDSSILDKISDRVGLRHLAKKPGTWESYVNGIRIFCRGPNYVSEQIQSNMNREKYKTDILHMKQANMNMVRVYCVVEKQEFYDLCDELGMLVLQDFPSQGALSNDSDLVRRAVPQARDMVNQLYNHPSIITWSLGEQPSLQNFEKICLALTDAAYEEDPYRFLQQGACVWEWKVAKDKYDWPIDYHLLCGWFPFEMNYLIKQFRTLPDSEGPAGNSVEDLFRKRPEFLEFIGEFGPPESLPDKKSLLKFLPEKDLWPLNWQALERRCLHGGILQRWIPEPKSLQQLIDDSQEYQSFLYKYHIEFYRKHKFDPCNGCLFFHFKDVWPSITASVIDYYGEKKKAYYTIKQAFNPIYTMMDWPNIKGELPGTTINNNLYLVNDFNENFSSLNLTWEITDHCSRQLVKESLPCSAEKNSISTIGKIIWKIPDEGPNEYKLNLYLLDNNKEISNNYYCIKVTPT